jgi:hypothetical protein
MRTAIVDENASGYVDRWALSLYREIFGCEVHLLAIPGRRITAILDCARSEHVVEVTLQIDGTNSVVYTFSSSTGGIAVEKSKPRADLWKADPWAGDDEHPAAGPVTQRATIRAHHEEEPDVKLKARR